MRCAPTRHELSLQESEERLDLAVESAGAGLWTLELSTGVFWATERGREIFGYSSDEDLTMERFEASVHPDDRDAVRGAIEQPVRTGDPLHVDYRILSPTARVRWISSRGRPRYWADGEPERLMGVSIDISERKRGEEALRASEARLAAGRRARRSRALRGGLRSGRHVHRRPAARPVRVPPGPGEDGLQALEFWIEHLHPADRPRMLDLREQMQDGRLERLSTEYRYLHPTRGEIWLQHLAGVAERDANRRALRTFGVFRDISERKRTEEQLHDLSRRLIGAHEEERALLARELHDDVTQRLAVLAIEVGRAEVADPDTSHARAMRRVREGLVSLSEDIHALAYQLHPSVLDELGLDEALRAECERRRRQGTLDLSLEIGPLPAAIGHDAALCLFRVAQEALNNVARHSCAGAASVSLRRDGRRTAPCRPRRRRRLRSDEAGSGRHLGLASMRERVMLANGTLDIESAPGQGTSVIVWAPRRRGGAVSSERRPRVLLADDHLLVAEALKSLLTPEFDLVGVVEDGRALVEAVGKLQPDVIVADVTMPHLNGIDALVQLRQGGDRTPVVFLTMHRDVTFARRALDAGASGFVLKHSASVELVAAIRAALQGKTYLTPQLAGEVLEAMKEGSEQAGDPVASLTPRQREVLQLLAEGRSAKEIAATLEISARTVEFHKYQMMETLDLHTNAELIHFAIKHGLVEL